MSLNKEARLREERKKLKEGNKRLPLNRPFPYEVTPFPADFFGIDTYSDGPPDPALTSDEA
jgi:hypothetical protein